MFGGKLQKIFSLNSTLLYNVPLILPAGFLLLLGNRLGIIFPKIYFYIFLTAIIFVTISIFFKKSQTILLLCAFFLFGLSISNYKWHKITSINAPKNAVYCIGKITGLDKINNGTKFVVKIFECKESIDKNSKTIINNITASLYYPTDVENFNTNDVIKFKTLLRKPVDYKNPASFPYKSWLASNNISLIGSISKDWLIKIDSNKKFYNSLRNKIIKAIDKNTYTNDNSKTFLKALTVGEKNQSSKNLFTSFRNTGTVHILAISGLHVGFVVIIAFFISHLVGFINPKIYNFLPKQRLSIGLSILLVWIYIFIAGFPPSAMRAGIMITIGLIILSGGFIAHSLSILAITAMLISAVFPLIIFNISFQLSVLAVLGILIVTPKFNFKSHNKFIRYVEGIILVSIVALLFTAPLIARYFHEISLMGIFANILVIPYVGFFIFPVTFISTVVSIFSNQLGAILFKISSYISYPLIYFVEKLSSVSKNYLINLSPTNIEIIAFYIILFTTIFWKKLNKIKYVLIFVSIFIFAINVVKYNTHKFEVIFFDVGQGDSTLIQFSNGQKVLVDGGGTKSEDFDIGEKILAPALWSLGIRNIDELILTHSHRDHYKGMAYIARKFSPKILWTNGLSADENEFEEWNNFIDKVKLSNVKINIANSETLPLTFGNGSIEFIYPDKKTIDTKNLNNSSLVLIARENNKCIMIVGDIEESAESNILEKHKDLKCDILKIAHHGSQTSSTLSFLKAVSPKIAVISVGKQNRYNMPSDIVLDKLKTLNIETRRTDIEGMIKITP